MFSYIKVIWKNGEIVNVTPLKMMIMMENSLNIYDHLSRVCRLLTVEKVMTNTKCGWGDDLSLKEKN